MSKQKIDPRKKSTRTVEIEQPKPQKGLVWRWAVLSILLFAAVTFFTTKFYTQNRLAESPFQIGPGKWVSTSEKQYRGQNVIIGWPCRWLGYRQEAEDTTNYSPMRTVALKFSFIALILDILAIFATATAGVQISRFLRRETTSTLSAILLYLCLGYLCALPWLVQYNFLGRIPVYPGDN